MANTSIQNAFERFWKHITTALSNKADVSHAHSDVTQTVSGFMSAGDKIQLDNGGVPIVTTAGDDGVAYTATVNGIGALTVGMKITIIPNVTSTHKNVSLNVNGLGAKYLRMPVTYNTSTTSDGAIESWIIKDEPVTLEYDGTYWKTISLPRPSAQYLYGAVLVENGGTGLTTVTTDSYLVGNGTENMIEKTPDEVWSHIKSAGRNFEGYTTIDSDGAEVTAEIGAEIFNNYSSNIAMGAYSHAEGCMTTTSGYASHAEGCMTTTSGYASHAEGDETGALGSYSHAEGSLTKATGNAAHAEGVMTEALAYQHAQGHYNNISVAKAGTDSGTGTGTAFVIGNGTYSTASNAFRVTYDGKPYAKSTLSSAGADYAEFFEWKDLNLNAEDRRGYFVTLDGDKIKIAKPNDYILGIISGQPSVVGNGDEDWMGRYVFDEFGAYVYEDFEYEVNVPETVIDEETGRSTTVIKTITKTGKKYKENPDYDPSLEYIQREDRPEWDAVGMLGILSVRDDGTCEVNGYCKVADGGIATASESGYRVIKRVNDNIVKVIFR